MAAVPSLLEALATIPEVRRAKGLRHPLDALLALACAAMLCGARTYSAIAAWGRNYDPALVRALGITHDPSPCAAPFCLVFRRLDRAKVEAVFAAWAEAVRAALPAAAPPAALPLEAVAIDGKTVRGSRKQGVPGAHLLSALSQRLGLTLHQVGVADQTNEIGAAPALLAGLVLEGRVFTMDALLTQREIAQTLVDAGGHYVMLVQENQPQLLADITLECSSPRPLRSPLDCGRDPRPRPWARRGPGLDGEQRLGGGSQLAGRGAGVSAGAAAGARQARQGGGRNGVRRDGLVPGTGVAWRPARLRARPMVKRALVALGARCGLR